MKKNLNLSIIIISYNTKKFTLSCINSIIKYTKNTNYEIIVVDNASIDGSVQAIKKSKIRNTKYKILVNEVNLGFAAANNIGAKKAKGKYLLFLNSDTKLLSNLLPEIVDWMSNNEDVAISTCKLLNADKSTQPSGGHFPNLLNVASWMFFVNKIPLLNLIVKSYHPPTKYFESEHEQDWITGAFFLVRRDIFNKLKGFKKEYFMYVEEADLCFRAKKEGHKIWYLPKWQIIHFGQASASSEFALTSEYKGIKLFYKNNYPSYQLPILRLLLKLGAVVRILAYALLGNSKRVKTYVKAFQFA